MYAGELAKLIRCETVSEYGQTDKTKFREFHKLLKETFPNVFNTCTVEDFDGSLLIKWQGKGEKKPVLFMNHHDVVSAEGAWEHEPFSGDIENGAVWGRGTVDTKSGLFCMLKAAEELISEGYVPEGDVYFESACTEETDGSGAEKICDELYRRGIQFEYSLDEGGLIVYDPIGGADGFFAMIATEEKGCLEIKFTARSEGGHAARPGKNTPLVRLGKFMTEAERKNSKLFPAKCGETLQEMLRRMSLKMNGVLKPVMKSSKVLAPLLKVLLPVVSGNAGSMMRTTLAFTMAQGSEAPNVLPTEAFVMGNMRFSSHQGKAKSLEVVDKICKKYDIEMEITFDSVEPKSGSYKAESFKLMERALKETYPDVIACPYVATTASDNRYMGKVADACYGFSPLRVSDQQLDSIHGLNENVDAKTLPTAVDFYKFMMKG